MAYDLTKLASPSKSQPFTMTIAAKAGLGKTSLASYHQNVIFIRTEDGTRSLANRDDIKIFPLSATSKDVFDQLRSLYESEHEFKTLVIDSVTQLNAMIESEIVQADPKATSINTALGGYGAGNKAVAFVHKKIRDCCQLLMDKKGMNIIFISHIGLDSVNLPDSDPFSVYSLRMHKDSVSHYTDNVDIVAYIKMHHILKGEDGHKKAIGTGKRVIICYPTPTHISKNRYGITQDIDFEMGENPLAEYMK